MPYVPAPTAAVATSDAIKITMFWNKLRSSAHNSAKRTMKIAQANMVTIVTAATTLRFSKNLPFWR
ncbi:MAG: hypothetical protein V3U52_04070 [Thermoplasmata archaeon]